MTITIEVLTPPKKNAKMLDPIECWGTEEGRVFQQYFNGKPQREYLLGVGRCERPISIWYNDDSMDPDCPCYRLSSESKKDLKQLVDTVKYVEVQANVIITLEVK